MRVLELADSSVEFRLNQIKHSKTKFLGSVSMALKKERWQTKSSEMQDHSVITCDKFASKISQTVSNKSTKLHKKYQSFQQ